MSNHLFRIFVTGILLTSFIESKLHQEIKTYKRSLKNYTISNLIRARAASGERPFFVVVKIRESFCGGAIIDPYWVITAAHCVVFQDRKLFIHFELNNLFPRLRCQTESRYVQTVPDGKCLCPDPPKRKVPMSRPSQTESVYVQTLPDGKSPCPDFRAFKAAYVQTFVRSKGKFVHSKIDNLCVHVHSIVRSKDPMNNCATPSGERIQILQKCSKTIQNFRISRKNLPR